MEFELFSPELLLREVQKVLKRTTSGAAATHKRMNHKRYVMCLRMLFRAHLGSNYFERFLLSSCANDINYSPQQDNPKVASQITKRILF